MSTILLVSIAGLLVAFGAFAFSQRHGRTRTGVFAGLGTIALFWLSSELWAYASCLACQRRSPSCWCEWTPVWMIFFTFAALADVAIFLVTLGVVALVRRYVIHR
jgi:uncharacterized membrane protein YecN with MAPEG domain